jgi:hypothetical protein
MIKYNLVCLDGHCWWSPTPELFIGKTCGKRGEKGLPLVICQEEIVEYVDK